MLLRRGSAIHRAVQHTRLGSAASHVGTRGSLLAIETSCDDTCAALLEYSLPAPATLATSTQYATVVRDVIGSQRGIHARFAGVVPHLASAAHATHIGPVADRACDGVSPHVVAVTVGPGMHACLHAGVRAAVRIATACGARILPVHHCEGHVLIPRAQHALPFPYASLLVSGGHTQLLRATGVGAYDILATSCDDAVGEAFDKVARMLAVWRYGVGRAEEGGVTPLQLEGEQRRAFTPHAAAAGADAEAMQRMSGVALGEQLEALAAMGDETAVQLPVPMRRAAAPAFSFSGLKSAVQRYVSRPGFDLNARTAADVAASFQRVATTHLIEQTMRGLALAQQAHAPVQTLVVAGGVARNQYIRRRVTEEAQRVGVAVVVPPPRLCTDNAAMIGWAAIEHMCAAHAAGVDLERLFVPRGAEDSIQVRARWPLPQRPWWLDTATST